MCPVPAHACHRATPWPSCGFICVLVFTTLMEHSSPGGSYLRRGTALVVVLVAFVTPAAAEGPTVLGQDLTVFGLSPLLQAGIAALCLVSIAIIMTVTFGGYTERTTEAVVTDPRRMLTTGLWASVVLLSPYVGLAAVMLLFDAVGLFSLALLTVLAVPLVWVMLVAIGIGVVAAGRHTSDKEGVQLMVVSALALPMGAFPVPFALLGIGAAVFGLGAIIWDLRYGESDLGSRERETYERQHRYL